MSVAAPLTAADCAAALGVSRETRARLEAYLELLARWNRRINLVGDATLKDPWRRHVLDCGQLWRHLPDPRQPLVDLGSGAGLPGLVLAAMGAASVRLIESDRRKVAFLAEAARVMEVAVALDPGRAEAALPEPAAVVTARALAPLPRLLDLAERFVATGTHCLFLKGRQLEAELTAARETWTIEASIEPSLSDPSGRILIVRRMSRAT